MPAGFAEHMEREGRIITKGTESVKREGSCGMGRERREAGLLWALNSVGRLASFAVTKKLSLLIPALFRVPA